MHWHTIACTEYLYTCVVNTSVLASYLLLILHDRCNALQSLDIHEGNIIMLRFTNIEICYNNSRSSASDGKCIRHHWQLMSSKSSKSCRCSRVFGIAREMPKVLAEFRLFNICWVLFHKWRFVMLRSIDDCYALRCLRRRFYCLTYASWPP